MATPGFQSWTTIFLLAAFQAKILAILFFFLKRGHTKANKVLAILLGVFGLTLVHYVSFWTGYMKVYPHFMGLSSTFPFLYGPLIYFYFKQLYRKQIELKDGLHLIPFIIYLMYLFPFYLLSANEKLSLIDNGGGAQIKFIPWIQICHMLLYVWVASKVNNRKQNFITWRRTLLMAFLGFVLSFMSYYLLILHPDFSLEWDYMIAGSMTLFIFIIALMGFIQPDIFSGKTMKEMVSPAKYLHSSLTPNVAHVLLVRLDQIMQEDEVFRDPQLNLSHLATKMNISKHQLSQLINEYKKQSFSEYINKIRIESVLKTFKHVNDPRVSAIQLAYDAGFNNKVSFYQYFKKHTGTTPGEYRKKVKNYRN